MRDGPRVFLTGGTGFIGRALVDELVRRGCRVQALARDPHSLRACEVAALGARPVAGDVTDRESMRAAMADADVVIHAAGVYELGVGGAERSRMAAVNVQGTENVLGLAHDLRCPRVLHVSSTAVFGENTGEPRGHGLLRRGRYLSHHEQTKTAAHRIALRLAAQGLPMVLACPSQVVGPNDHSVFGYFLRMHLNHLLPPVAPCPGTVLSPVHVDDLARGLAQAALHGRAGRTYVFAGEATSLKALFGLWQQEIPGGQPIRLWVPSWAGWLLFAPLGPLLRAGGYSPFLSAETARLAARDGRFTSQRALAELGWSARPAREAWRQIGEAERRLLEHRRGQGLAERLRPLRA